MKKEKKNQRNTSFAGNPIPTYEKEHLKEHFFRISVADAEGTGTYTQTSSMKLSDSVHLFESAIDLLSYATILKI